MYLLNCFCAWTIVCLILTASFCGFLILTHFSFTFFFPVQIKIPWILVHHHLCCLQWDISHWDIDDQIAKINNSDISMAILGLIMIFWAAADANLFVKDGKGASSCVFQVGIGKSDSNMVYFFFQIALKLCWIRVVWSINLKAGEPWF